VGRSQHTKQKWSTPGVLCVLPATYQSFLTSCYDCSLHRRLVLVKKSTSTQQATLVYPRLHRRGSLGYAGGTSVRHVSTIDPF
jgi:hypothetical protein